MAYVPTTPPRNFSIDSYKRKLGDPFKITGLKRQLGQHLGKPYLSGAEAKHHLVSTLKKYSSLSYNKKQIIDKMKKEYSLKLDVAKALGNYLIPEKVGRTAVEEKKWKAGNIRYRRLQGIGSMGRLSGSPEDKGKTTRDKLLKARVPESSFAKNQTSGQASVSSISGHSIGGIANAHEGAAGIARVSPLEVKDGSMKVKLNKGGQGLAVQPGKGVTGIANLKDASNDETGSNPENHKDMSHQVPLAGSGLK